MVPLTVKVLAVLSVPPLIVRFPAINEADVIASEPFEMFKLASLAVILRLLTALAAEPECVTLTPGRLMTASSAVPGTAPVLQFSGLSQLESPPPLVHVAQDSNVRSSRRPIAGRNSRRGPRQRLGLMRVAIED
jgi:hypothetical protein